MTKETMTIHEALTELKTLDKRIKALKLKVFLLMKVQRLELKVEGLIKSRRDGLLREHIVTGETTGQGGSIDEIRKNGI